MAEPIDKEPIKRAEDAAQEAARKETAAPRVRRLRAIIFQGVLIAAVSLFAILALLARTTAYFPMDVTITKTLQTLQAPWFDLLMRFVSALGYLPETVIITGGFLILLYVFGYHWESLMLLVSIIGIGALNIAVKFFVHRPRPPRSLVEVFQVLNSYSFPSGHVMYFLSLYGFLVFLAFALLKRSWMRTLLVTLFTLLILLVGVSRIYLGEHWASDVLGAYLLGSIGLTGVIALYRWGKGRVLARQPVAPEPIEPGITPHPESKQRKEAESVPVTARDNEDRLDREKRK